MISKFVGLLLVFAVSLGGCLEASKVARIAPNPEESEEISVTLSLPRASLANLGAVPQFLVIQTYKVENGNVGSEAREAYRFTITDAGEYSMEGLPLGEIEFQVALLDEGNIILAEGKLRSVINPGLQTLPQLILKPKKPTSVDVNLQVALNLINFPDVPVQIPEESVQVKTVLDTYCSACHNNSARPMGDLNLAKYPYTNLKKEGLAQILTKVVDSMTGSNGVRKMPPDPRLVKTDEVALVKSHLQKVLDAGTSANRKWVHDVKISLALGGPGRLESSLVLQNGVYVLADRVNLVAGSNYAYNLTAFGPGGSKLFESVGATLAVPLDGQIQVKFDITYQAPVVTLPVVVEPSVN